jgi:mono/diheme cytochrome c family protein/DNA-directed RNA polymerase subunit RPC12/RpoP
MMRMKCTHCSKEYSFKEEYRDRNIKCQVCKKPFKAVPIERVASVKKNLLSLPVEKDASVNKENFKKSTARPQKSIKTKDLRRSSPKKNSPKRKRRKLKTSGGAFGNQLIFAFFIASIFAFYQHVQAQSAHDQAKEARDQKWIEVKEDHLYKMEQRRKEISEMITHNNEIINHRKKLKANARNNPVLMELSSSDLNMQEQILAKDIAMGYAELMKLQEIALAEFDAKMSELRKEANSEIKAQPISPGQMQPAVDPFFAEHVVSIFMNRCFKCHGNEKSKGGLRMHTRKLFLGGGDSGVVIVPGKPKESLLMELIALPADDTDIMPPKGGKLTEKDIENIAKWIKDGANW